MKPQKPYKITGVEGGGGLVEDRATNEEVGMVMFAGAKWMAFLGLWPKPQSIVGRCRTRAEAAALVYQAHLTRETP